MKKARFLAVGFVLVLLTTVITSVKNGTNVAAAQLSSRSIKMSSSAPSATGVTYTVGFTTSGNFQSLIIDFCADSPIIGSATCTNPTGMSVASAGVTFTSGTIGTVSTTGTTAFQLKVAGTAAQTPTSVVFNVTNVTNPSSAITFYARIYTYSNATFGTPTAYTSFANPGSTIDTGGVAISTANAVNITTTIAETLTFCTSGTSVATCPSATATGVTFGSGSPLVLGGTLSTVNNYTVLSTNAVSGAVIAMKINNACGGLSRDGGTTCPIAAAGATAITIATNAGLFGAAIATSTGGTGASVVPAAPYDQGGVPKYAMDTTGGVGVTSTYGDTIATASGPVSLAQNTLTFAADTSPTTPAGVYTATIQLIATGTF